MTETIGTAKGERTETRLAYRSGYYSRSLITRVGTLELRVPQDRDGRSSTELFQRYQRSEKARGLNRDREAIPPCSSSLLEAAAVCL
jgi:transposase-like protein